MSSQSCMQRSPFGQSKYDSKIKVMTPYLRFVNPDSKFQSIMISVITITGMYLIF